MHNVKILCRAVVIAIAFLTLTGCAVPQTTKLAEFPKMYEENPHSILILPPINESTDAEAKDYYSTTIPIPVIFHGYYVFPYELTSEILKQEGIYDSELLRDLPLAKFREYFGADAVLFTTIKKWDLQYIVISSSLTVSIECEMKSTHSSETLWNYNGTVVVDLSGQNNGGGGLAGLIIQMAVTAANSAAADYVKHAHVANRMAMAALPYGQYHPQYGLDKDQVIVDQTPPGKTAR
jgi:hypothetical protein